MRTILAAMLVVWTSIFPVVSYASSGFFSNQGPTEATGPGFFPSKGRSPYHLEHDQKGQVSAVVDNATGFAVHMTRDAAGRVTQMQSPASHTQFAYDNAATLRPSLMVRDGKAYRITYTGAFSTVMQPLHKGTIDASDVIVASNNGADWMDNCSGDPNCATGGGTDPNNSLNWMWSEFTNWVNGGAIVGGITGFWVTWLDSTATAAVMADGIAIFGVVFGMAAGVFYSGYQFGTWAYNNYGGYWWNRLAP